MGIPSVYECQEILRVAKPDTLDIFGRTLAGTEVSDTERTMYRYYLEAIIVMGHFQRPGAVGGMTVSVFVMAAQSNRHPAAIIAVSK